MNNIGKNRQLFTDDSLIDKSRTTAGCRLFAPIKREVAFRFDAEWESWDVVYQNIVKLPDGSYRMYYKGTQLGGMRRICYIESKDGVNWSRPALDTNLQNGEKTNIVSEESASPDNLYVFWDTNPACPENERLKGIYGQWGDALFYIPSDKDGNLFDYSRGVKMMTKSVTGCYFDSLNTVYWDDARGKYVAFVRGFHLGDNYSPDDPDAEGNVRDIRFSESEDFINWTMPRPLTYNDGYDYQLYANAVTPYSRADGLYVALPTRYIERPWSNAFEGLCGVEDRRHRHRGTSLNDTIFMSSRSLSDWFRFSEAVISSGPEQENNWVYGDCYPCVGFIETPSAVPGCDNELSFFMKEQEQGSCHVLYRYTLRLDGFVARTAPFEGASLVTLPFIFEGSELELNFATSALGGVQVILRDEQGNYIESLPVFGDDTDRRIIFEQGSVADFAGKAVTLEFKMTDASVYSFRFV